MAHPPQNPARVTPGIGQLIGGRFLLERELGVGGMGAVYAAHDRTANAPVALKLMRPELAADPRALERFRREGLALATLTHPTIVQIREVGELQDGTLFIAMELLEGESLASYLERVGRLELPRVMPILETLCAGLQAAHTSGVIHRDIKPSNIHLVDPAAIERAPVTGEWAPVKLVDFGVARVRGLAKVTSSGLAIGTVRYMAPEQLTGAAVDERADVYSLGMVLYEMLAGEHAFARTASDDLIGAILVGRATPLSSLRPDLPPALIDVVHRALARLPTDRFGSALELWQAFSIAARGIPTPPPPTRSHETLPSNRPLPADSGVRPTRPSGRTRPPLWLFLPLIVGACVLPVGATVGFASCGSYITDFQLQLLAGRVRAGLIAYPELSEARGDLDRLQALHDADRLSFLAVTAFNARVQESLRADDRLDERELRWIGELMHDIVAHDGRYDMDQYAKMSRPLSD